VSTIQPAGAPVSAHPATVFSHLWPIALGLRPWGSRPGGAQHLREESETQSACGADVSTRLAIQRELGGTVGA
jgi:hypothetical protein